MAHRVITIMTGVAASETVSPENHLCTAAELITPQEVEQLKKIVGADPVEYVLVDYTHRHGSGKASVAGYPMFRIIERIAVVLNLRTRMWLPNLAEKDIKSINATVDVVRKCIVRDGTGLPTGALRLRCILRIHRRRSTPPALIVTDSVLRNHH